MSEFLEREEEREKHHYETFKDPLLQSTPTTLLQRTQENYGEQFGVKSIIFLYTAQRLINVKHQIKRRSFKGINFSLPESGQQVWMGQQPDAGGGGHNWILMMFIIFIIIPLWSGRHCKHQQVYWWMLLNMIVG